MKILLISPYHGGSHKAWAEGYQRFSRHDVSILSLPPRFWKWRMHGGSVTLARKYLDQIERSNERGNDQEQNYVPADIILATDMVDLTTFLALTRSQTAQAKVALYMHENQLTYPLPQETTGGPMRRQKGERDLHYAFVNYSSLMAADLVLFNSSYHLHSFFDELPQFLKHFPEFNELDTVPMLRDRSQVLPVGIDLKRLALENRAIYEGEEPLIIWNQRWEYDKNPKLFFEALYEMSEEGLAYRLAICGKNFRQKPFEFDKAKTSLSKHLVYSGYADEEDYAGLLQAASITISTAYHEFFGISIIEAAYCSTFPILPNRLSYPDIIPRRFHDVCLYETREGLLQRIRWSLQNPLKAGMVASDLAQSMEIYDWRNIAIKYDDLFDSLN